MATPLAPIVRKILKSGEEVFKRGNRRVSRSAYRSQQWRLGGGKAGTADRLARKNRIERFMRSELGAPPAGKEWFTIAAKYPERFADYTEGLV